MGLRLQARSFGWSGQFNGVDNYVSVGSPTVLQLTGPQTWACWFSTPNPQTSTLMSRNTGNTATTLGARLSMTSGQCVFTVGDGVSLLPSVVSPLRYADRRWHHMAGVYDGTALALYMDGLVVAQTTTNVPAALASATFALALGARSDGQSRFTGWLDECMIVTRALTAKEVAALYSQGLYAQPWPDTALVAWWPFNEGQGSTVIEVVNSNHGTWQGTLGTQWSTFVAALPRGAAPPPQPPVTGTPYLTVSPASGNPGATCLVGGVHFAPGYTVTVTLTPLSGSTATLTQTVSAAGLFVGTLTVPSDAGTGAATLTASDPAGDTATTSFTVTPVVSPGAPAITAMPLSGTVGTVITVTGSNFTAGQSVTVTFIPISGSNASFTATADGSGAFTGSLTVTSDAGTGAAVIHAADSVPETANYPFTVTASSALTPGVFPTMGMDIMDVGHLVADQNGHYTSVYPQNCDYVPESTPGANDDFVIGYAFGDQGCCTGTLGVFWCSKDTSAENFLKPVNWDCIEMSMVTGHVLNPITHLPMTVDWGGGFVSRDGKWIYLSMARQNNQQLNGSGQLQHYPTWLSQWNAARIDVRKVQAAHRAGHHAAYDTTAFETFDVRTFLPNQNGSQDSNTPPYVSHTYGGFGGNGYGTAQAIFTASQFSGYPAQDGTGGVTGQAVQYNMILFDATGGAGSYASNFKNPANWDYFDLRNIPPANGTGSGSKVSGGQSTILGPSGRYFYVIPQGNSSGTFGRFDTQGSVGSGRTEFSNPNNWWTFDAQADATLTALTAQRALLKSNGQHTPGGARNFSGAAIAAGRFIVFAPWKDNTWGGSQQENDTTTTNLMYCALLYDETGAGAGGFATSSNWTAFDLINAPSCNLAGNRACGYTGATADASGIVYLVPTGVFFPNPHPMVPVMAWTPDTSNVPTSVFAGFRNANHWHGYQDPYYATALAAGTPGIAKKNWMPGVFGACHDTKHEQIFAVGIGPCQATAVVNVGDSYNGTDPLPDPGLSDVLGGKQSAGWYVRLRPGGTGAYMQSGKSYTQYHVPATSPQFLSYTGHELD